MRTTHRAQRPTSRSALAVGVLPRRRGRPGGLRFLELRRQLRGGRRGRGGTAGVSLILKTLTNPYFVSMKNDAQKAADAAA